MNYTIKDIWIREIYNNWEKPCNTVAWTCACVNNMKKNIKKNFTQWLNIRIGTWACNRLERTNYQPYLLETFDTLELATETMRKDHKLLEELFKNALSKKDNFLKIKTDWMYFHNLFIKITHDEKFEITALSMRDLKTAKEFNLQQYLEIYNWKNIFPSKGV